MPLSENTDQIVQPEYHSGILDDDFVKVFEPYRKIQKLLGSSRVHVKNRLVTPPTKLQKLYTTICVITMSISFIQLSLTYAARFSNDRKMFYLWMGGIGAVLVVFAGCIIYARFYDNEGNVKLYIKMQEIDRLMKCNETVNKILHKRNRKTAYSLATVFAVLGLLCYILVGKDFSVLEIVGVTYTLETFVIELSCCSGHISFFYTRARGVNFILSDYIKKEACRITAVSETYRAEEQYYVKTSAKWQDFKAIDTEAYIKEIFRGFMLFNEQYRFQMFLFCAVLVVWLLFTFEHAILALQSDNADKFLFLIDILVLLALTIMELLLLLVICLRSENFKREVRRTKHLSILILCGYVDGPLRKKAKNMLKLIEETPPTFTVFGMWCVDARLVFDIFHIVTNFILTIIQFTFL